LDEEDIESSGGNSSGGRQAPLMEAATKRPSEGGAHGIDYEGIARMAKKLEKEVDIELLPNLYTEAQDEIFYLMHNDSWRRYIRSHLYKEFLIAENKRQADLDIVERTFGKVTANNG